MNEDKLYMPANITVRPEYFVGFGKQEAVYTIIVSAIAIAVAILIHIFTGYIVPCVFGVLVIIALTVSFVTKVQSANNLSMLDYVLMSVRFKKEQQKYLYCYMEEIPHEKEKNRPKTT